MEVRDEKRQPTNPCPVDGAAICGDSGLTRRQLIRKKGEAIGFLTGFYHPISDARALSGRATGSRTDPELVESRAALADPGGKIGVLIQGMRDRIDVCAGFQFREGKISSERSLTVCLLIQLSI